MPIKKVYYIECKIPCTYEPYGFHEDIPDCDRYDFYVSQFKHYISEKTEVISKDYKLKHIYYSKTVLDNLYIGLNVFYRYHYIIALVNIKIGILRLEDKPDDNLIKLKFPKIYEDCYIVSRYEQVS